MADEEELRQIYAAAVARGAVNTAFTADEEPPYDTLALLTWAKVEMPELWHSARALDVNENNALATRAASNAAATVLCLAHGALTAHGRDVDYRTTAWIDRALVQAEAELHAETAPGDDAPPVARKQVRAAVRALANATWAAASTTTADPILIPEQVAEGLGHLLVIYAIARAAGGS